MIGIGKPRLWCPLKLVCAPPVNGQDRQPDSRLEIRLRAVSSLTCHLSVSLPTSGSQPLEKATSSLFVRLGLILENRYHDPNFGI